MRPRVSFASVLYALVVCIALFVSMDASPVNTLQSAKVPTNDEHDPAYIQKCVLRDNTTDTVSFFSTPSCVDKFNVTLSVKPYTSFVSSKGWKFTVAFDYVLLQNARAYSKIWYSFGNCTVGLRLQGLEGINEERVFTYLQPFNSTDLVYVYPQVNWTRNSTIATNKGATTFNLGLSKRGLGSASIGGGVLLYTTECSPFNKDGSITFTQQVENGNPNMRLSLLNVTAADVNLVDKNGKAIIIKDIPNTPEFNLTTQSFQMMDSSSLPTALPSTQNPDSGGLSLMWICLIAGGCGLVVLVAIGIVAFICWKMNAAKKAEMAALAAKEQQGQSVIGTTATTVGSTMGTVGDDQVNVKIVN